MKELDYLIEYLINEDENLSNIEIPNDINGKKDLYRALRNIRDPKSISSEYLKVQDKYLKDEINKKGITDEKDIKFDYDIISIWQGDITTLKCDAIVNACNKYLLGCFTPNHKCIDNEIHSYAGMQLRNECNDIMKGKTLPNGEVVLTNGYNLPCKYIFETVGPEINGKVSDKDIEELKKCYVNSLKLMIENNLKTIAFPCISTGVFSFPNDLACKIAISTVKDFIKNTDYKFDHIIFNVFKDIDKSLYERELNNE